MEKLVLKYGLFHLLVESINNLSSNYSSNEYLVNTSEICSIYYQKEVLKSNSPCMAIGLMETKQFMRLLCAPSIESTKSKRSIENA